jgi:hypothetical protein
MTPRSSLPQFQEALCCQFGGDRSQTKLSAMSAHLALSQAQPQSRSSRSLIDGELGLRKSTRASVWRESFRVPLSLSCRAHGHLAGSGKPVGASVVARMMRDGPKG